MHCLRTIIRRIQYKISRCRKRDNNITKSNNKPQPTYMHGQRRRPDKDAH